MWEQKTLDLNLSKIFLDCCMFQAKFDLNFLLNRVINCDFQKPCLWTTVENLKSFQFRFISSLLPLCVSSVRAYFFSEILHEYVNETSQWTWDKNIDYFLFVNSPPHQKISLYISWRRKLYFSVVFSFLLYCSRFPW